MFCCRTLFAATHRYLTGSLLSWDKRSRSVGLAVARMLSLSQTPPAAENVCMEVINCQLSTYCESSGAEHAHRLSVCKEVFV